MLQELERLRTASDLAQAFQPGGTPRLPGLDDGTIIPASEYPPGTSHEAIRTAAAARAPLTGTVRVAVVLADFPDKPMTADKEHFEKLFFSLGELPHGSVRDYYREVTHGLVDIVGEVIGPVRLPQKLSWYANGNFGIGRPTGKPRAQIMARDAAVSADPLINYAPYDNDGNGFVDAFIVLHSGPGGRSHRQPGRHLVAQVGPAERVQRRRRPDLRLPHGSRGRQDRCLCPRTGAPAVRLPRSVRRRRIVGRGRRLVPDGRRFMGRRR
jgi:immune inhibitor A